VRRVLLSDTGIAESDDTVCAHLRFCGIFVNFALGRIQQN
jgi:hypothetical protein